MSLFWFFALVFPFSSCYSLMEPRKDFEQQERKQFYAMVEPCILAGCPVGGVVLDPFLGSGTTGAVAKRLGRQYIGIDLNPVYCQAAEKRIREIPDGGE